MALPTYGAVPQQEAPPQQINWRRRLRRAAVCAGAGLMVSRALVNQGGTVVDDQMPRRRSTSARTSWTTA